MSSSCWAGKAVVLLSTLSTSLEASMSSAWKAWATASSLGASSGMRACMQTFILVRHAGALLIRQSLSIARDPTTSGVSSARKAWAAASSLGASSALRALHDASGLKTQRRDRLCR